MVSASPLFRGAWSLRRAQSTVLSNVWPEVLLFTAFATVVVVLHGHAIINLGIGDQLLTVGGVVLGLVISFRTSSSYERYEEGAQMWTNISTACLELARMIWIFVPNERTVEGQEADPTIRVIIEKKTMINMLHGFAVSVKHLLRDEPGVFYEDLYPSVAFLPKYPTRVRHPNDILPLWHVQPGHRLSHAALRRRNTMLGFVEGDMLPLKPSSLPPDTSIYDYLPILRLPRWGARKAVEAVEDLFSRQDAAEVLRPRKKRYAYAEIVEGTVPLEISLYLSSYTAFLMRHEIVPDCIAGSMTDNITSLHDSLGHLERICNTPLPFAYQAHLRMSVWLYILFFPFQIVRSFGYLTIPATAAVTFLICGFLELGKQIENPFNYDVSDLDLDAFCERLKVNLNEITTYSELEPSSYLFSHRDGNQCSNQLATQTDTSSAQ